MNGLLVEFEREAVAGRIDLPVSFWFALDKGYTSLFERLVEQYPNRLDPNGCDDKRRTALVSEFFCIYYMYILLMYSFDLIK
jgi:hypothetical protein